MRSSPPWLATRAPVPPQPAGGLSTATLTVGIRDERGQVRGMRSGRYQGCR